MSEPVATLEPTTAEFMSLASRATRGTIAIIIGESLNGSYTSSTSSTTAFFFFFLFSPKPPIGSRSTWLGLG